MHISLILPLVDVVVLSYHLFYTEGKRIPSVSYGGMMCSMQHAAAVFFSSVLLVDLKLAMSIPVKNVNNCCGETV
jgi:hypothetical protein